MPVCEARSRRVPANSAMRGGRTRHTSPGSVRAAGRAGNNRRRPRAGGDQEGGVAEMYNGFCVKCKEKRDFEGEIAETKTGMRMAKGKCPVCGTTVNRILGKA